jgi:ATP-binding cassette subfamily B protein
MKCSAVVETAVGRAGADDVIDRLALGLDTQLGPTWDEGVEVLFGQWQKLALARGHAHRMADLIVVMDGAHVVEVGSHADLMARRGTYAELYGIQAAAFRDDDAGHLGPAGAAT